MSLAYPHRPSQDAPGLRLSRAPRCHNILCDLVLCCVSPPFHCVASADRPSAGLAAARARRDRWPAVARLLPQGRQAPLYEDRSGVRCRDGARTPGRFHPTKVPLRPWIGGSQYTPVSGDRRLRGCQLLTRRPRHNRRAVAVEAANLMRQIAPKAWTSGRIPPLRITGRN